NAQLNVSSYMGMILLIGLDMKNGILLVEYIQQLRREGMELRPALLQAGRTRFRPILMTSLAAILGLLPLAFGIGPGSQMQQPLAIMVIGGLTANMLFTRMVIPAGYLVLERRRERKQAAATPAPATLAPPPRPRTSTRSSSASAPAACATSSPARTTSRSRRSSSPTTPTTSATTRPQRWPSSRTPRRPWASWTRRPTPSPPTSSCPARPR